MRPLRARRCALGLVAATVIGPASAGAVSPGALQQRINQAGNREQNLQAGIARDARAAASFNGRVADLQARLNAIQTSLDFERNQLAQTQTHLRSDRAHLTELKLKLGTDEDVLRKQLVASYETPPPDVTTVVLDAHGFSDLLERMDYLNMISRHNAAVTAHVARTRAAVATETTQLAQLEARQSQTTRAVLLQRDEAAQLHLQVLDQQLAYARARSAKASELASIHAQRSTDEQKLAAIERSVQAAPPVPVGTGAPFAGSTGDTGFFQAPGTNYSVGNEPTIASRLNTMGKALGLHLIGISGYRSPQHSVEVGGFADDPHTRGEASDTPGVEGVPEATLEQYGLTRPFPGAAEADHIQLA